jgi:hypothetical protein
MIRLELDYILSDKETFDDTSKFEKLQNGNRDKIVNYFMNIKDKIKLAHRLSYWLYFGRKFRTNLPGSNLLLT